MTANLTAALALKDQGNALYKARQFSEALAKYDEALALYEHDLTLYNNKAAVLVEMGNFSECISLLQSALAKRYDIAAVNKEGASYEKVVKLLNRKALCHTKLHQYDEAVECYNKSLCEDNCRQTRSLLADVKKEKDRYVREAYIDPVKGEEARERGNNFFKESKFVEAKQEYDEAILRNPTDARLYSNRAAALTKLLAFPDALKDLDECLRLDPNFVKAYSRKGTIYYQMKDFNKALDAYSKGLALDPSNSECLNGRAQVQRAVGQQAGSSEVDPEQVRRAMADPEIQAILSDPQINLVLKTVQERPQELGGYLKDEKIANAIQKLVAAGILKMK